MEETRPNPEKLLKQAQEESQYETQGKLKIYLGAAPGVGKTYSMLSDARSKRAQGLDVVIGIVESHGRKEVEALIEGLEIIPLQKVIYREKELNEFDLDATLRRNPGLILIDEMAHTNAPDLRHAKRWQDIKEILDRGIDVYTTLNVQHIESFNDIVTQITHTLIKETVPDSMITLADNVELIDLPPDELIKRLSQGKIYFSEQAELAAEHFFRKGNLIALRELALRVTAEYVGAEALSYRQGQGIQERWPTQEKIMVCVGPEPESINLIRHTRRLATSLQVDWIAVHIDAARLGKTEAQHNSAIQNLRLAEQLGAETRILAGFDLVKEIIACANQENITQIVIGKKIRSRWRDIFFNSLADEVVRQSGNINVNIITGNIEPANPHQKHLQATKPQVPWKTYGFACGIVLICTLLNTLLFPILSASNLIMVYLLGAILAALFGRTGPAILASSLSVLCYDFFFIPPYYSFSVSDIQYFFTLLVMLTVSLVISNLTLLVRRQAEAARIAEDRSAALHGLSRKLASTRGVDHLLEVTVSYIAEVFNSDVLALLSEDGHLSLRAQHGTQQALSVKEDGIIRWVYDIGQTAGLGTDTLPFSDAIYVPLLTSQGSIGVLKVRPLEPQHLLTPEQMQLLESCANQTALALEVDRLHEHHK
jgi:two-component system sensor histidine kinase KdpD